MESGEEPIDGGRGGHLALFVSAEPVGQSKKPAVRPPFFGGRRLAMPQGVFVVIAHLSGIGMMREVQVEQRQMVARLATRVVRPFTLFVRTK